MNSEFDARLRAAARRLDNAGPSAVYQRYLDLEHAYADRVASDEGMASVTAMSNAIIARLSGESAARAEGHFADAERAGVLGSGAGRARPVDIDAMGGTRWRHPDLEHAATAARSGDRVAVAEVLRHIRPLVTRYARARLVPARVSPGEVDDVVQVACLAVLTRLAVQRSSSRPFSVFVYGVASEIVADRLSGRNAPTDAGDSDTAAIVAALDALPTRMRDVLVLRIVVGLSSEETARELGTTPGAVRVAQNRALARLRARVVSPED